MLYLLDPQPLSVIKAALDHDCDAIKAVKIQTIEICEYCVFGPRFYDDKLKDIKYRTDKIEHYILQKVIEGQWELQYVNPDLLTQDIVNDLLTKDSYLFQYIPLRFKTVELCKEQVKKRPYNLQYVPDNYLVREILDESYFKDKLVYEHIKDASLTSGIRKMIDSFNTQPRKQQFAFINDCTEDEMIIVLNYYPQMYRVIKNKTIKVTKHAVTVHGWNLQYVPNDQYNDEVYNLAITSQPLAIKYKR